ncbi:MAG: nitrous oxide reductase family maturation protein NosD, partial [Candidatus Thorarchaeota archaeon]
MRNPLYPKISILFFFGLIIGVNIASSLQHSILVQNFHVTLFLGLSTQTNKYQGHLGNSKYLFQQNDGSNSFFIVGNENFSASAMSNGWIGTGTLEYPIRISEEKIEEIIIKDTTLHFKISNCQVNGSSKDGIILRNVSNCQISKNNILKNWIHGSNTGNGVSLEDSKNISIIQNSIIGNNNGIFLRNSKYNIISGNGIINNVNGIRLEYSDYNSIQNNNISHNGMSGIILSNSLSNHVSRNIISQNDHYGLQVFKSGENIINDNNISDIPAVGINLFNSVNCLLTRNMIINTRGIQITYSPYCFFSRNWVKNSENLIGIIFTSSDHSQITNNSISNTSGSGIILESSNYCLVENNRASNNILNGISILDSDKNMII